MAMKPLSMRILELSVPKGNVGALCEVCGQKATTKCEECKQTHYCTDYHKSVDLKSFHKSVCEKLAYIRNERPLPFTEEDRLEVQKNLLKKKQEIQTLAEITTRKWLLLENAEYAYPSAMSALNIAKSLRGSESIEVIYPMCLLSEVCLWLGDLKAAQEYMILAGWTSQKYNKIPAGILAELHRLTGLVCMKAQKWEQSREAFAECVYALAVEYGTSHIRLAVGYGHLGLTLLQFDNEDGAMASFHKMADKWLEFLLISFEKKTLKEPTEADLTKKKTLRDTEFQYMESRIVFKWIYEAVRRLGMNTVTDLINFKILCIQALFQMRENRPQDAVVYKNEALATATRTKQQNAVPKHRINTLKEVLNDDFLLRWEKKHNRPRTVATKYLEMIKAINV